MTDASIFAAESQLGSLNIETTERRILSKQKRKSFQTQTKQNNLPTD